MNFRVNAKQIKTRELIAAQTDMNQLIGILSRFLVDDDGEPIPQDQAREMLLDTDLEELQEVQEDFLAAFNLQLKKGGR